MPSIYLHIPFCEAKCIYCDFNSYAKQEQHYAPFVDAICADIARGPELAEMRRLAPAPLGHQEQEPGRDVPTIFFGGGTPSILSPRQIGRILETVAQHYNIAADAEISMEANPGTISEENFLGYRAAGVNRLSMGVQSFDDKHLKKIGRIHSAAEAEEAYWRARWAGFDNINLDFIFGLPNQDLANWTATLDKAIELGTDHLSLYSLIVEEHTPLWLAVDRGQITPPGEDEVADMYELARDHLKAGGFQQYEVSNWSRNNKPCRHNLVYWRFEEYLAFGPGAHGWLGNRRFWTILTPKTYIARLAANETALDGAEFISGETEIGEYMMLGLRTNAGVKIADFERRFGHSYRTLYGEVTNQLVEWGLLIDEPERGVVRLSDRGMLLGNEVFARFLPDTAAVAV